jgi:NAD(P)H-quinone oxidoreductase subunit K
MYYHRGMFGTYSYSTVREVEKLIPMDVYSPGYPPKLEAIIDAIMKLRERKESSNKERIQYFMINHRFHHVRFSIHTRNYDQKLLHQYFEPQFEYTFEISYETFRYTSTLQLY